MRDLRFGTAKIILPEAYLKSNGPNAGASFGLFPETFVGTNLPGNAGDGLDLSAH